MLFFAKNKIEPDFFFVRGAGKSGTSWIMNILNLHPEIECRAEFYFDRIKKPLDDLTGSYLSLLHKNIEVKKEAEIAFENLVKKCMLSAVESDSKKKFKLVGEKTPGELEPFLLNNKKSILIIRDGRDVLVSCAYHSLRLGGRGPDHLYPEFVKKIQFFKEDKRHFLKNKKDLLSDEDWFRTYVRYWNNNIKNNLETIKKLKLGLLPAKVHVVKYENLYVNFESEKNKLYNFLGVDPRKALSTDSFSMPGFDMEHKENPTSHYRKGIVGDWKNYFTEENVRWFKEEAGDALINLGYEKTNEWKNVSKNHIYKY